MITLWHGSRIGLKGYICPYSTLNENGEYVPIDFGVGFYTGSELSNAIHHVFNYVDDATLTKIELKNWDILTKSGCKIHVFTQSLDDIADWALYVAYCHDYFYQYTPICEAADGTVEKEIIKSLYPRAYDYFTKIDECDIVVGPFADDRMQYVYNAFFNECLGIRLLKEALKFARLGTQFVFKTQKACNLLNQSASITTCRLSDFLETDSRYKDKDDFLIGQEISLLESNLRINVTLTNRKFRNTVRDRYIDEILKEKENNLKKYGDANNIENPEMLDCLDLEG